MLNFRKGVLLLADIKNYTSQANKLGSKLTGSFLNHFESTIRPLVQTFFGYWLRRIGDGILVFFDDETNFLNFTSKLREMSQEGELDWSEFIAELRFVAHFGNFAFEELEERIEELIGADGIKVFRIEKYADAYDLVITEFLLSIIKNYLQERKIAFHRLGREHLKGFDEEVTLFKLVFPAKDQRIHSNLLKYHMEQLELKTKEIPIFGDLYPPLKMEKNFINLDIKSGESVQTTNMESKHQDIDKLLAVDKERRLKSKTIEENIIRESLNIEGLYDYYPRGIILGLPGSGKTTILKYFAFRDFKFNRSQSIREHEMEGGNETKHLRLVLLVECRNVITFEEWYSLRYGNLPIKNVPFNIETILGYLAYCFLFHRERVNVDRDLELAERLVYRAFRNGYLTIMIDALDEASDIRIKDVMVEGMKLLFKEQDELMKKEEHSTTSTSFP